MEIAQKLEKGGFAPPQARVLSEVIEEAVREARPDLSHLATKEDLRLLKEELRAEFRSELGGLRAEIRTEMKDLELRLAERLRSQMLWFFTIQTVLLGIAVAVFKLIP